MTVEVPFGVPDTSDEADVVSGMQFAAAHLLPRASLALFHVHRNNRRRLGR